MTTFFVQKWYPDYKHKIDRYNSHSLAKERDPALCELSCSTLGWLTIRDKHFGCVFKCFQMLLSASAVRFSTLFTFVAPHYPLDHQLRCIQANWMHIRTKWTCMNEHIHKQTRVSTYTHGEYTFLMSLYRRMRTGAHVGLYI